METLPDCVSNLIRNVADDLPCLKWEIHGDDKNVQLSLIFSKAATSQSLQTDENKMENKLLLSYTEDSVNNYPCTREYIKTWGNKYSHDSSYIDKRCLDVPLATPANDMTDMNYNESVDKTEELFQTYLTTKHDYRNDSVLPALRLTKKLQNKVIYRKWKGHEYLICKVVDRDAFLMISTAVDKPRVGKVELKNKPSTYLDIYHDYERYKNVVDFVKFRILINELHRVGSGIL